MAPRVNLNVDRWTALYVEEERFVLRLAAQPGPTGDAAIGVATHLPLRQKAREQMLACLKERLRNSISEEQQTFLTKLDSWTRGSPSQLVHGYDHGRQIRETLDTQWIYSPAPGFSSLTDEERFTARQGAERELTSVAEQLRAAWYSDGPPIGYRRNSTSETYSFCFGRKQPKDLDGSGGSSRRY